MKRVLFLMLAALLCLPLCACVADTPVLMPQYTVPPAPTATPMPTPTPAPTPTPEPTPAPLFDVTGAAVSGPEHYTRYLTFRNIQVYEQCEDTFVDAVMVNTYPSAILCAVTISFYETEEDEEEAAGAPVAEGKLQTRDGQYVLSLQPGETTVFAQIDTDMTITALPFVLDYDMSLGIWPEDQG